MVYKRCINRYIIQHIPLTSSVPSVKISFVKLEIWPVREDMLPPSHDMLLTSVGSAFIVSDDILYFLLVIISLHATDILNETSCYMPNANTTVAILALDVSMRMCKYTMGGHSHFVHKPTCKANVTALCRWYEDRVNNSCQHSHFYHDLNVTNSFLFFRTNNAPKHSPRDNHITFFCNHRVFKKGFYAPQNCFL